jgi:vacuolar protein sorting-associated protein 26
MAASFFGFGVTPKIDIKFNKKAGGTALSFRDPVKNWASEDRAEGDDLVVYQVMDPVDGSVKINMPSGKKLEHAGIKVELVGQVQVVGERSGNYPILSLHRELEPPGILYESKSYNFDFGRVEKQHDSYNGSTVRLRYFVRVTISRNYNTNITEEADFIVENYDKPVSEENKSIKMEVGIEDCLHIEFEYEREKYHLDDVITGKINFLLVRIKIKHMELQIVRKESVGSGTQVSSDSEVLSKYEIMDGAPVRGEVVPIRLYLTPIKLNPTMLNVEHKFSVRYYLNLVLIDEEERRYFKQHEISLVRAPIAAKTS